MTNKDVVRAWINGQTGKAGSLSTDGMHLYSYRLMIGTDSGGVIYNHTAGGGSYYSQTTSTHVGIARGIATSAKVISPDVVQEWDNPRR